MRIALASIHPRPLSGQIEGLVGLAQALQKLGHQVTIVSPFPSDQLLGPQRFRLAGNPPRILFDQPARIVRVLRGLLRIAPNVDIIHLNLPTPSFSILADLLQARVRVPVVVGYEAHLVNGHELFRRGYVRQAPTFYGPRLLINNRMVARLTIRSAAHYVVNSQVQKDELVALGLAPDRISTLPIVLPRDKFVRSSEEMRALFPPGRVVTCIGHYNHVKGVDVLIRAMQLLAPCHPDWYLALAWSGVGQSRAAEELLRDKSLERRVYHFGQVSVPDLLAASDLVALPYRLSVGQAACPAMLIEALAANIPVVTTNLAVLRELTDDGKLALLVQPDDARALATGIDRILSDPPFAQEMRRAQRQWAQDFEPQVAARKYEGLYRQVAGRQD
jgi:glycosyltransferase involved in cell wall biosynthesis